MQEARSWLVSEGLLAADGVAASVGIANEYEVAVRQHDPWVPHELARPFHEVRESQLESVELVVKKRHFPGSMVAEGQGYS